VFVGAEDHIPEAGSDLSLDRRDQPLGVPAIAALGTDPDVDLAQVGKRPHAGVAPGLHIGALTSGLS